MFSHCRAGCFTAVSLHPVSNGSKNKNVRVLLNSRLIFCILTIFIDLTLDYKIIQGAKIDIKMIY
jgi:hypothetical protein